MKNKFIRFIDKMASTSGHHALCEAIKKGYKVCLESEFDIDDDEDESEYDEVEQWCDGRVHPEAPEEDKAFAYEHKDAYEDIWSDNTDDYGRPTVHSETTTLEYANELAQKHNITLDEAKRLINIYAASGEYYFTLRSNSWQRSQFALPYDGSQYNYCDCFI